MKQIIELFNVKDQEVNGKFGVEVEVEGSGLRIVINDVWRTETDGSLRGEFPHEKAEYVFVKPLSLIRSIGALSSLQEHLADSKLDFSFRTSVHVHLNVQKLTELQTMNIIYLYYLFEDILSDMWGEGRKGNRFCLRLSDCDGIWENLVTLFSTGLASVARMGEEAIRYGALNLYALRKYGSLEFRGMRGTLDGQLLGDWLKVINALSTKGEEYEDVSAIFNDFTSMSINQFGEKIFGKALWLRVRGERYDEAVSRGFSLTLDIPYAFKSYKLALEMKEKRAKRERSHTIDGGPPGVIFEEMVGNFAVLDDLQQDVRNERH